MTWRTNCLWPPNIFALDEAVKKNLRPNYIFKDTWASISATVVGLLISLDKLVLGDENSNTSAAGMKASAERVKNYLDKARAT